jgi:prepilin-type processing-associated H-X9-DG protein
LTIGDAGAEDAKIVFDGNAQDYHIGLDDSADSLVIGLGSTLGTTEMITLSTSGIVINEDTADYDFRIESNGNANMLFVDGGNDEVLIGSATSDRSENFQVLNSGAKSQIGIHTNRASAGGSELALSHNRNTSVGSFTVLQSGDTIGHISFYGCDGTDIQTEAARISAEVDGTPGANDMPTKLVFSTTADGAAQITERMRITTEGCVIVSGTTKVSHGQANLFQVGQGDDFFTIQRNASLNVLEVNTKCNTAVGRTHFGFNNSNGTVGTIQTLNSGTSYNTSSDYRLKENVDYDWDATTRLKQLKPARFNFIIDDTNTLVDGFLAHEAQAVVPECVTGTKDETETLTKVVLSSSNTVLSENIEQSNWTAGKLATTDYKGSEVAAIFPSDSTWVAEHVVPKMQGIDQAKLVPLLVKTILELEARIAILEG